jgi:hypothetical protein
VGDPRQQLSGASPAWLRTVARLAVPGVKLQAGYPRHHTESCSGTLLQPQHGSTRPLLLTAWHCLEHYTNLARDIRFTLPLGDGRQLSGSARVVLSGGSMEADWALLRLPRSLRLPQELPVIRLDTEALAVGTPVTMAGFSRDDGAGAGGQLLSYDARCQVSGHSGEDVLTDCSAHRGASGGAVFRQDARGVALVGVISRGDGAGRTIYVPAARFAARVLAHR